MLKSWQELEDFVDNLLKINNSIKPKGSGNGKKEEDIISDNIIAQCKYTENKNHSLLEKDISRLLDACKLQNKFPLFITGNQSNIILSIPINESTNELIEDFIKYIISKKGIEKLKQDISSISTVNNIQYGMKLSSKLLLLFNNLKQKITKIHGEVDILLKNKYDDLTICDLFEGH